MLREESFQQQENESRNSSKVIGEQSFPSTTLWLERTRWHITFRGARRDMLRVLTQLPKRALSGDLILGQASEDGNPDIFSPSEVEQKIACILSAMDPVLDRCENTACHTSRSLLCWVQSRKISSCTNKEFALVAEKSSRQWYRTLWKRFLTFVIRGCRLDEQSRHETNLVASVRNLALLDKLWEHRIWDFVDASRGLWPGPAVLVQPSTHENIVETDTNQSMRANNNNNASILFDTTLESSDNLGIDTDTEDIEDEDAYSEDGDLFDELCDDSGYASEDQFCSDRGKNSVDHSGNATTAYAEFLELLFEFNVALITEPFVDGSPASTLLSHFSGILGFSSDSKRFLLAREYCPRLSPLIYIQRLLCLELALPCQPYPTLGISSRPQSDQLKQLNKVREQYMVIGAQSCFAEFVSLRDAGRTISRTEPPAFILRWSDDGNTVHFGPEQGLTMEGYRQLIEHFIFQAEKLSKKLMLGASLDINIGAMKDSMINSDHGYSFVKHPDNNLDPPYQKLLVQACTSSSAGLSRDGKWSWTGITAYLKDVEKLEEMLAGGMYTACGQVPRLRELLSLELENGPFTKGSISLWNGYAIYIIRHHKAKRQTNKEFYVARFLPARLGATLCKYMACIRRLADMLRREHSHVHQNHPPRSCSLLFHSGNLPWKPLRITSILRKATIELWGYPVNAQLLRQIAIGITEKHVREVHKPFNRYDDARMLTLM